MRKTASWAPTAALITAIVTLAALPAHACWDEAAARYRVSSELLYAIARTESALDPQAVGRNRNGTRDIGLMQINSAWLPPLAAHGIGERDLFDPCTSIHVGAWILAGNVQRLGYTWDAVGAYNAANPALRRAYVDKVRRHLRSADDSPHRARHSTTRTAMSLIRRRGGAVPVAVVRALAAGSALAGTTGTEFQTMYTTLLNWATGFLGKSIAIAAFILGAGIGIARSSPIPALAGVVFALFMVYVPTIIDSIMTAVI